MVVRAEGADPQHPIVVGDEAQVYADGCASLLMSGLPEDISPRLELRPRPKKGWVQGLLDGNADVVFLNAPPQSHSGISCKVAAVVPIVYVVPSDCAYAGLSSLSRELFAQESLLLPIEERIGLARPDLETYLHHGSAVRRHVDVDHDWATLLEMVRCNAGLGFVPQTLARFSSTGLKFVPLADQPPAITHYLAWRQDERRSDVLACITAILKTDISGQIGENNHTN